jgi:hypothetical protein
MLIAHVSGIPVEELAPFAGGAGSLLAARLWLMLWIRGRMEQ